MLAKKKMHQSEWREMKTHITFTMELTHAKILVLSVKEEIQQIFSFLPIELVLHFEHRSMSRSRLNHPSSLHAISQTIWSCHPVIGFSPGFSPVSRPPRMNTISRISWSAPRTRQTLKIPPNPQIPMNKPLSLRWLSRFVPQQQHPAQAHVHPPWNDTNEIMPRHRAACSPLLRWLSVYRIIDGSGSMVACVIPNILDWVCFLPWANYSWFEHLSRGIPRHLWTIFISSNPTTTWVTEPRRNKTIQYLFSLSLSFPCLELIGCVDTRSILILRLIITLICLAIFSSTIGFLLDALGPMRFGLKFMRRHAFWHILSGDFDGARLVHQLVSLQFCCVQSSLVCVSGHRSWSTKSKIATVRKSAKKWKFNSMSLIILWSSPVVFPCSPRPVPC